MTEGFGLYPTIVNPPYTTLTAYDLNPGTIKWQIGLGDDLRLAAQGIKGTGTAATSRADSSSTATGLVFATAADRKVHVYDSATGTQIAELPLGGATSGGAVDVLFRRPAVPAGDLDPRRHRRLRGARSLALALRRLEAGGWRLVSRRLASLTQSSGERVRQSLPCDAGSDPVGDVTHLRQSSGLVVNPISGHAQSRVGPIMIEGAGCLSGFEAVALAVAITCCAFQSAGGQAVSAVDAPIFDQLVDGNWVLRIDRAWHGNGAAPQPDRLPSRFRPVSNGSTYPIFVTNGGARVEIGGKKRTAVRPPMKGVRSSPTEPLLYNLNEGTFAGGRFVVWSGKNELQGELTISRVWRSSERGTISRQH